jgi:general secretion pathway protein A
MYLSFYGLREEPFRQTPDPRFFHLARPHRAALLAIIEAIVYRRGFMVLTGPVGSGKTTLLHSALSVLSYKFSGAYRIPSAFVVNPTLRRDEFLEFVLDELEIECPSTSKPRRLAALEQLLMDTQRRGSTVVLIIDEAHLLTPELLEEIRLLSNTDTYRGKLMQIILSGQPELLSLLGEPSMAAMRQRIAMYRDLRLLSLPETQSYMTERLNAAGLRTPSPFSGTVIEDIHLYSQGVPRLINMICDQSLVLGFESRRNQIGTDIVREVAIALSLPKSLAHTPTSGAETIPPPEQEVPKRPPAPDVVVGTSFRHQGAIKGMNR